MVLDLPAYEMAKGDTVIPVTEPIVEEARALV